MARWANRKRQSAQLVLTRDARHRLMYRFRSSFPYVWFPAEIPRFIDGLIMEFTDGYDEWMETALRWNHLPLTRWSFHNCSPSVQIDSMFIACENGHWELIHFFLTEGVADVMRVLGWVSRHGHLGIVKRLLNEGATCVCGYQHTGVIEQVGLHCPHASWFADIALFSAVTHGQMVVVQWLLWNMYVRAPTITIMDKLSEKVAFHLMDTITDTLVLAVEHDHIALAEYLTEFLSANVVPQHTNAISVVLDLMSCHAYEVIDLELVPLCDDSYTLNVLHFGLCMAAEYGYISLVRWFVECGAAGIEDALCWASYGDHFEVMRYLVECGA